MFLDWKNQHSKDVSSSQIDIQAYVIPIKFQQDCCININVIILKYKQLKILRKSECGSVVEIIIFKYLKGYCLEEGPNVFSMSP